MAKHTLTFEIDEDMLGGYTDEYLAELWHIAQANPASIEDHNAGALAESIGRQIIRRWLKAQEPALWNHQGRHYYWSELRKLGHWESEGKRFVPDGAALLDAARVIQLTPAIRTFLEANDPKALEQLERAIAAMEARS